MCQIFSFTLAFSQYLHICERVRITPYFIYIYVGGFFPGGTPLLVLELKLGLSLVMPFLPLKLAVVCVTSVLVFQFKFVSKPKGTIENKENVFKRKKTIR